MHPERSILCASGPMTEFFIVRERMSWGVGEQEQGVNKNIIYCLVFVLAGPLMHPERGILCASGPMRENTYERWNCTVMLLYRAQIITESLS